MIDEMVLRYYCTRFLSSNNMPKTTILAEALSHLKYNENSVFRNNGPYKEIHRLKMITWGESVRDAEPDFFCRSTIPPMCNDDVVLISDCRRPTDIDYFQRNYKTLTVRIEASLLERERRGFVFVEGIDDMPSECGLDEFIHDMTIVNDHSADLALEIEKVVHRVLQIL